MIDCIAKLLPLFIFYLFFAFPDDFLYTSISPLGRFISIMLIVFYSLVNTYTGLLMCCIVIFYYNLNSVEKTSSFDSFMLTGNNVFIPTVQESFETDKKEEFRKKNCDNGVLKHKGNKVHNENAEHIFSDLEFLDAPCNPCDDFCGFTIKEKLKVQEELVYPKKDDNWVMNIWNTWFSENPPYAFKESPVYSKL
jgi:hypothetical protein